MPRNCRRFVLAACSTVGSVTMPPPPDAERVRALASLALRRLGEPTGGSDHLRPAMTGGMLAAWPFVEPLVSGHSAAVFVGVLEPSTAAPTPVISWTIPHHGALRERTNS